MRHVTSACDRLVRPWCLALRRPMSLLSPRAVLFDLDGTLVDSRSDIAAACNHALTSVDRAPLDESLIAGFVGDGARMLVARALSLAPEEVLVDRALTAFHRYYEDHAGGAHDRSRCTWRAARVLDALHDRRRRRWSRTSRAARRSRSSGRLASRKSGSPARTDGERRAAEAGPAPRARRASVDSGRSKARMGRRRRRARRPRRESRRLPDGRRSRWASGGREARRERARCARGLARRAERNRPSAALGLTRANVGYARLFTLLRRPCTGATGDAGARADARVHFTVEVAAAWRLRWCTTTCAE